MSTRPAATENENAPFFITPIRLRGKFNDSVQGDLYVGQIVLREMVEIRISSRHVSNSVTHQNGSNSQTAENRLKENQSKRVRKPTVLEPIPDAQ